MGRWLGGAAWSSSAWRGATQAVAVVGERDSGECSVVLARDQSRNFFWLYIAALLIVVFFLVVFSFVAGGYLSKSWYDRVGERALAERARPKVKVGRTVRRLNACTQCDRRSTDINEIERLTIGASRDELRRIGDSTDGCKHALAERLHLRRIRNDELVGLHADNDPLWIGPVSVGHRFLRSDGSRAKAKRVHCDRVG